MPRCGICTTPLPDDDPVGDQHKCDAGSLLDAALRYAAAGVHVFPVRVTIVNDDGGELRKKLDFHGQQWSKTSTTSLDMIRRWWGPGGLFPHDSVAIDCGKSKLVVVDPDKVAGIATWEALVAEHQLAHTNRAATPGGGQHWSYREHPRRVVGIDASGKVAPSVDVRGLGGFVIAVPSVDDRGAYRWLDGEPDWANLPIVPDLVIERMNVKPAAGEPAAGDGEPAAAPNDGRPRRFTRRQAEEFSAPLIEALKTAKAGHKTDGINHRLNNAAKAFSHFVPAFWTVGQVHTILNAALAHTAYDGKTWQADRTINSGLSPKAGDWVAELVGDTTPGPRPEPEPEPPVDDSDFWSSRPTLAAIRDTARERRVAPWAVLAAVLATISTRVGPHVVLPATVGSIASLNTFWALVGASGSGKDAALAVAEELLWLQDNVPTHEVGTGQGIDSAYTQAVKKGSPVQFCDSALFTITEIDTLAAHAAMGGANIMATLRKVFTGSALGARYADKDRRRPVKAHRYRAAVLAGVQPARSAVLLGDADAGTPQRWLFMPTNDPGDHHRPTNSDQFTSPAGGGIWQQYQNIAPHGDLSEDDLPATPRRRIEMKVCDTARDMIIANRDARLRAPLTAADGDLTGHLLLTRLKAAALLALFDNARTEISDQDWELAGTVIAISNATREVCAGALQRATTRANVARANTEADRAEVIEDRIERRVAKALARILGSAEGWMTRGQARGALASRDRLYFDAAISRLIRAGMAIAEAADEQGGVRYRVTPP